MKADAIAIEIERRECWVVSFPKLIALKRAAGRGKDRETLAELEALLEERERALVDDVIDRGSIG